MNNNRFTILGLIYCALATIALYFQSHWNFTAFIVIASVHFNTRAILDKIDTAGVEKASYGSIERTEIK